MGRRRRKNTRRRNSRNRKKEDKEAEWGRKNTLRKGV